MEDVPIQMRMDWNESFLYVENADEISLANARGKIVMVNDPVRKELYQKLVKAGASRFYQYCRFPIGRGRRFDTACIQLYRRICQVKRKKQPG